MELIRRVVSLASRGLIVTGLQEARHAQQVGQPHTGARKVSDEAELSARRVTQSSSANVLESGFQL